MISYPEFCDRLSQVQSRMAAACRAAGRDPASVSLLPVTKYHPADAVEYVTRSGLPAVGENRVQEVSDKQTQVSVPVRWELIGHLQSNKATAAVQLFDRIQSVDSAKLIARLDRAAEAQQKVLSILLQCNVARESQKSGLLAEALPAALEQALTAKYLKVDGLMMMAPIEDGSGCAAKAFEGLRHLQASMQVRFGIPLPELSMGMTGDLEAAITAGSTQIRVGTALFGARPPA
jgi:pyridoxal phosphate enzyme (YggS family)